MSTALLALTAGAFGIGTTEFVIMGLLLQVSADMSVSVATAGLLISGYALGVAVGAPLLTLATRRLPRKTVLLALMAIFTLGNLGCALAPDYPTLMAARILTSLAHGTFFGTGSIVATGLVPPDKRASALATMFSGLTVATLLGVPAGAWIGLHLGWRATFWAVTAIGLVALAVLWHCVPRDPVRPAPGALHDELSVLARPQVWLGLAVTALGFGGVFAFYTYIQPVLIEVTGLSASAVSGVLLLFGGGMVIGNIVGGKLADRAVMPALFGTVAVLTALLALTHLAMPHAVAAITLVGLLGVVASATVAPMQMRVLDMASGAGQGLVASLNIAAFNLGNALGAWVGGQVVGHGLGLQALGFAAAGLSALGLLLALVSHFQDGRYAVRACSAASCLRPTD